MYTIYSALEHKNGSRFAKPENHQNRNVIEWDIFLRIIIRRAPGAMCLKFKWNGIAGAAETAAAVTTAPM